MPFILLLESGFFFVLFFFLDRQEPTECLLSAGCEEWATMRSWNEDWRRDCTSESLGGHSKEKEGVGQKADAYFQLSSFAPTAGRLDIDAQLK